MITLEVSYFASVREARGASSDIVELAGDETAAGLLDALRRGPLAMLDERLAASLLIAVNQTVAAPTLRLRAGDEIAVFPPMTGG